MFSFLFDVNKLLVGQFYSAVDGKISEGASFLTAFISLKQDGYIGSAVLFIIGVFSVTLINWQYIIRKVMIALLIGLLPVVAVISVINRESLIIWFRELIANIFLQACAAVLAFLIVLGNPAAVITATLTTTVLVYVSCVNQYTFNISFNKKAFRHRGDRDWVREGISRRRWAGFSGSSRKSIRRWLSPCSAAESAGSSRLASGCR